MSFTIMRIARFWQESNRQLWHSATKDRDDTHVVKAAIKRSVDSILHELRRERIKIEALKIPSQSILKTMQWLSMDDDNFAQFALAFHNIAQAIKKIGEDPSFFAIEFSTNKSLWQIKRQGLYYRIQFNFACISASSQHWDAFFQSELKKQNLENKEILDQLIDSDDFKKLIQIYQSLPPQEPDSTNKLSALFNKLNATYFNNELSKPKLIWMPRSAYRQLGRYSFEQNCIALSPVLNHPKTPEIALEFVLYHEMLHIFHGKSKKNGRVHVHTPAFKRDEERFPNKREIEKILSKLHELHKA